MRPTDAVFNEAFNVGQTAHNYRIREIAEIVAGVVPGCRLEYAPDAGPDKRSYRVSFEKIRKHILPAFKPRVGRQARRRGDVSRLRRGKTRSRRFRGTRATSGSATSSS